MDFNLSVAKAANAFFGALRTNALAGIAFAVIVLLAYLLHLAAGVVAAPLERFLYFAVLGVIVATLALAVLLVVAKSKHAVTKAK